MLLLHHPFFFWSFSSAMTVTLHPSVTYQQPRTWRTLHLVVARQLGARRLLACASRSCSALPAYAASQHLRSHSGGWAPFFTALTLPTRPKLQKDCSNGRRADHRQKSQMGQVFSQGQKISRRGGLWVCLSRERQANRPALRAQAHPLPRRAGAAGVYMSTHAEGDVCYNVIAGCAARG